MNKIVVAPNAFKNSLTADEAARFIEEGLKAVLPDWEIIRHPVGDGGDGTGALITQHKKGEVIQCRVRDPLNRKIDTSFGLIDDGSTAVIEMADASGIRLLKKDALNPLVASSVGTGDMIVRALEKNVRKILLTIGGSATVDGGTGMLRALGVRFLDREKHELLNLPEELPALDSIDLCGADKRLINCELVVLCDVENPAIGTNGAATVFGPQKGATPRQVELLEEGLKRLCEVIFQTTGKEVSSLRHGGAAGAVAAGLYGLASASLVNGLDYFLDLTAFDKKLNHCDWVITGEGKIDSQTLSGKAPYGVALRAGKREIPVAAFAGDVEADIHSPLWNHFELLLPVNFRLTDLEEALENTGENLRLTAFNFGRMLSWLSNNYK